MAGASSSWACCLRSAMGPVVAAAETHIPWPRIRSTDAFGFEQPVGLADGHWIDVGRLRHLANAGQEVARLQLPASHQGDHLIDDLPVNGDAAGGGDVELAGRCVHVY